MHTTTFPKSFEIHSCAVKVDLSRTIKLSSATKGGYTLQQPAKMSELAKYLRGGK